MPDGVPSSPEAEIEVIAAAFVDARILDDVAEIVQPEDFFHPVHRDMFAAALDVWSAHKTLDQPLLIAAAELRGVPKMTAMGCIGAAIEARGTTENAVLYAETIRDRAILRRLADAGEDIRTGAVALPSDVEVYVAECEQAIREINEGARLGEVRTAEQCVAVTMERIYAAKSGDDRVLGLMTGFKGLDEWTDGLPRGVTYVVARPKHGKSAFGLQLARRVAERGLGVFIWSGEMPEDECFGRMIGQKARLCVSDMCGRTAMTPSDLQAMSDAAAHVSSLPIMFDEQTGITADQVCARAQKAARELEARGTPLRLIVVDHFHLMKHPRKGSERTDEAMARTSGRFRDWSKDMGISAVVLAQLSRGPEQRESHRPRTSDIRECGAAEQDAKLILGLCWPHKFDQQAERDYSELWVLEQRQGQSGLITMAYDGPQMRWMDRF